MMYTLVCRKEINGENEPLTFPKMEIYHSRTLKSVKEFLAEAYHNAEDAARKRGYRITTSDMYGNGLYAKLEYELGPSEYPYTTKTFEIFRSKSLDNRKY